MNKIKFPALSEQDAKLALSSPRASGNECIKFYTSVVIGYASTPKPPILDILVEDATYIDELQPTVFDLERAKWWLKTQRPESTYFPSTAEIRRVVKESRRHTELLRCQVRGVQPDIRLLCPDDRESEEFYSKPSLPQLEHDQSPTLESDIPNAQSDKVPMLRRY